MKEEESKDEKGLPPLPYPGSKNCGFLYLLTGLGKDIASPPKPNFCLFFILTLYCFVWNIFMILFRG